MPTLPDPRCYAASDANPLEKLAAQIAAAADAAQRAELQRQLQQDLKQALAAGRDDLISTSLAEVSSPAAGRTLWLAVDEAINAPSEPSSGLAAALFAIPVVLVVGGLAGGVVPGLLPDVRRLTRVLESEGAVGPSRNFGLNQALCADTSVEASSPSRLYALLRRVELEGVEIWPDLIPAEIRLDAEEERAELRFVTGIAVTGAAAPSFISTAGAIGLWGMAFSRELVRQLSSPGLSLLPIPRPPSGLLQALHRGHQSREEMAFQLFVSRVLREFRSSVGEPRVSLAAVAPNAIDIGFASDFDLNRAQSHRWLLHPLDELSVIVASIEAYLHECRVEHIQLLDQVKNDAGIPG